MRPHSQSGKKWQKFNRKYGPVLFIGIVVLFILLLVGFLMYVLSSPDWRVRPGSQ